MGRSFPPLATVEPHRIRYTCAYDQVTKQVERIESIDRQKFTPLVLIDSIRTLVTPHNAEFVTFTLPAQYFPLPKCCDRD